MSANLRHPIIEKNVHKIIGKYCKQPSKLFLSFYNDNKYYDKPLGRFIFELCKEAEMNCNICGISLSKHIYHLYCPLSFLVIPNPTSLVPFQIT